MPGDPVKPHFSPICAAGEFVFVSGQLAFDAAGAIVPGGVEAQTRQVLANVATVLTSAGLGLGDLVKTTVFITRAQDFPAFNQTYAAVLGEHRPARSTVVTGLAVQGAVLEIEAVARRS